MNIHLRRTLAAGIAAIAVAITVGLGTTSSAVSVADPVCPASTNWDNGIHACR